MSTEDAEAYDEVVWVVGFRTSEPYPVGELSDALGLRIMNNPELDRESTEGWLVMAEYGAIRGVAPHNYVDASGATETLGRPWELEDILTLPAP